MKTIREINQARRNNPAETVAEAAYADLCAATSTLDTSEGHDQAADIRAWFTAADRAYNARVAAAREAGTLSGEPARPATPALWPPREGDVWITRHGWCLGAAGRFDGG